MGNQWRQGIRWEVAGIKGQLEKLPSNQVDACLLIDFLFNYTYCLCPVTHCSSWKHFVSKIALMYKTAKSRPPFICAFRGWWLGTEGAWQICEKLSDTEYILK